MNDGMKLNLVSEPNGSVTISNDRTWITIHPDGTIAISSYDPIQLTGASLAKLDQANLTDDGQFAAALLRRIEKKTSN